MLSVILQKILPLKWYLIAGSFLIGLFLSFQMGEHYVQSEWDAEKATLSQKALDTVQQRQELAQLIGGELEAKLSKIQIVNKTITQKVIHEVTKETVYTNCRNTPGGVHLIEDAINNQGQSTNK